MVKDTILNGSEFKTDASVILAALSQEGLTGRIRRYRQGILKESFAELVASDKFSMLLPEERMDLFQEYDQLIALFQVIDNFLIKYVGEIHVTSIKANLRTY